jgi:hypothetical protein
MGADRVQDQRLIRQRMGVFKPGGCSSLVHGVQEGLMIFKAKRAKNWRDKYGFAES